MTPALPEGRTGDALRILIAEDNAVNAELLLFMLDGMGCPAHAVVNGAEAVEALRRQVYDVVFMDVQMPVMDGIEAARLIRLEWGPTRRPRIIALTAGVMSEEVQACRDAGMDDFLSKPLSIESLATAIASCRHLQG